MPRKPVRPAAFPAFVPPQLAMLVAKAPEGDQWLHEIKFDGYRAEIAIADGQARIYTRRGHDWSARFPSIIRASDALPCQSALLDGEIAALNERGLSDFSAIQGAIGSGRTANLFYYAFDLLHLDGKNLLTLPLIERKAALRKLLGEADGRLRYSDHVVGNGKAFFEASCRHACEGIISKRLDETYRPGKRDRWLKIKCVQSQEFVVGGWIPRDNAKDLAALLVGYFDHGKLQFVGRVGTGFNERTRRRLISELTAIARADDPFGETPGEYRNCRWVEPRIVVEVAFREFTTDGFLRHSSFKGVREDKKPEEVTLEVPREVPPAGVGAQSKSRWRRSRR